MVVYAIATILFGANSAGHLAVSAADKGEDAKSLPKGHVIDVHKHDFVLEGTRSRQDLVIPTVRFYMNIVVHQHDIFTATGAITRHDETAHGQAMGHHNF